MGIFDWLRPAPRRGSQAIARELSAAVLELHPSASRVEVTLSGGRVVEMSVAEGDVAQAMAAPVDRGASYARVAALCAELARAVPTSGERLTVMRDRVIWMPAVVAFAPGP